MDERLRRLGRAARTEAEATTDLDAAWASFREAAATRGSATASIAARTHSGEPRRAWVSRSTRIIVW